MYFISLLLILLFKITQQYNDKSSSSSFDSLISSQCKSRCLSLYPWIDNNNLKRSHKINPFNIKWHKVMDLCAKNTMCLQCSLPCDIPKSLLENCKYLCKNRHLSCIDSCNLLTKLNNEKYGQCDLELSSITLPLIEQTCFKDSDCEDTQKCCNNKCTQPLIDNKTLNFPQIPTNLTIIERKKGKTIILKWQNDMINNNKEPIVYVVEGKWSLNTDDDDSIPINDNSMTKWGYLAQTVNNNWIILRSIHRGRFYKFRVAAISPQGSYGYSQPTNLFILSKSPKPPSVPMNLTITQNRQLTWLPPKRSDLPIYTYKIIIYEIINGTIDSQQNINDYENENDDDQDEAEDTQVNYKINSNLIKMNEININDRKSIDLQTELDFGKIYFIELYALSKYRNKDLLSVPAKLRYSYENNEIITTPLPTTSLVALISSDLRLNSIKSLITNFTIDKAYFQNGLVKAKLNWIFNKELVSNTNTHLFTITWFSIKCSSNDNNKLSQQLPISATTVNTFFEIYELKYNCDYVVNVKYVNPTSSSESILKNLKYVTSAQFKVDSCEKIKILGSIQPHCPNRLIQDETTTLAPLIEATRLPRIENIKYKIIKQTYPGVYNVEFTWNIDELPSSQFNSLIGYQITIVPKAIPGLETYLNKRIGSIAAVVNKNENKFIANSLSSGLHYIFQIQCLLDNSNLVGPAYSIDFKIRIQRNKLKLKSKNNDLQEMLKQALINQKQQELEQNESLLKSSNYFYYKTNLANKLNTTSTSLFSIIIVSILCLIM